MKNISRKNRVQIIVFLLTTFCITSALNGQSAKYIDAKGLTMVGKAEQIAEFYHRIDTVKYNNLPRKVKYLATCPTGLAIAFKTNSSTISAKWSTKPDRMSENLSLITFKGLGLYIKKDDSWTFAAVGKPSFTSDDCQYTMINGMNGDEKECLLYLPFFSEITSLEIGIDSLATMQALDNPFRNKILVYGTSIVHGVSASRPGLSYPSRLTRMTGFNFINLGFSGNARMENEMADYISNVEADAYIIDCLANCSRQQVTERTAYMVNSIRKRNPQAPIILVEHIMMDIGNFKPETRTDIELKNKELGKQYDILRQAGVKKLYYIKGADLIGHDQEATSDGVHPNDVGFERMTNYLQKQISGILIQNGIK